MILILLGKPLTLHNQRMFFNSHRELTFYKIKKELVTKNQFTSERSECTCYVVSKDFNSSFLTINPDGISRIDDAGTGPGAHNGR